MPISSQPKRRPVFTSDNYALTECQGCEASPVRDDGGEVLHEHNWLRTCDDCRLRFCMVCMPPPATVCRGCEHARSTLQDPAHQPTHPAVPTPTPETDQMEMPLAVAAAGGAP